MEYLLKYNHDGTGANDEKNTVLFCGVEWMGGWLVAVEWVGSWWGLRVGLCTVF